MNDELKLGFVLELENSNSPTKKKNTTSKRKAEDLENSKSSTKNKKTTSKRKTEDIDSQSLYKKQKGKLKGMNALELHVILQKDFITFCQDQGLVAKSVKCFCGNENMRLNSQGAKKNVHNWVCQQNGHKKIHGIKKGTVFENSHISIPDILFIMYMWLYRYSTSLMMHECNNGPNAIIGWSRRCMEFCQMILEFKNEPLGGENKVVEIFECKFKEEDDDKWVFCALEQDSTKSLLIMIDNKTSNTILQLFNKYILPGTTIASMFWSPYTNVTKKDFHHLTMQGSLSFYNITTKVTMDTYDAFVEGVNRPQPLTHLVKNEYEASFFEKMYRRSLYNAPDAYLAFLKDVSMVYKPQQVVVKFEPNTTDDH